MSNFKNSLDSLKSSRLETAPVEPAENPNDPIPYALTAVEHRPALEHLRQGARQEFRAGNSILEAMADQVAEDIWTRQRLAAIHHQSLSLDIEKDFAKLLATHPNADAAMHTIEAWKKNQAEITLRYAFTDQHPLTHRFLSLYRTLHQITGRRSR